MKNKTYWLNRAIDRQSTIDKLSQSELNEIKKIYDSSQRELTNMINEIYETYSKKTGLDISELKRLMSYNETDKFWKSLDGQKMKQYVKENYKSRITRLEAYKAQLQAKCNNLADKQEKIMAIAGKNAIKSSYFKTIYDTSIGVNLDLAFNTLDDRTIDLILKEKWLGSNYSDRVWKNTNQLAENLKRILTKTVMTGGSQSRAIKELRDSMNSEWYKAERLVRTEMNHFHNQSELQAYEEMGVEEYVYVATLDNRTSEICQELDGKKFKLSEAEEGVNYPPMHPYCRSTVRAYIGKDVEKDMQRRARDPQTGENKVINNMSYSEWMSSLNQQGDVLNDYNSSMSNIAVSKLFKNVIDEWKKNVRTTSEDITMSEFTVTRDGKRYYDGQKLDDGRTVKFGKEKHKDINTADWFKKNIWKDVEFQQRIDFPQKIRTPDLVFTKQCPLLNEQTIEIKQSTSKSPSAFYKLVKESNNEQSTNFIFETTDFNFSDEVLMKEINKMYEDFEWIDTIIVKRKDKLVYVLRRNK